MIFEKIELSHTVYPDGDVSLAGTATNSGQSIPFSAFFSAGMVDVDFDGFRPGTEAEAEIRKAAHDAVHEIINTYR